MTYVVARAGSQLAGGQLSDASVIVIGAGVVGACVSYRLAQAGASVTVVDGDDQLTGASSRSFAWANAYGKYPREYWQLNFDGMKDYWQLQNECGGRWFHPSGSLRWAESGEPLAEEEVTLKVRQARLGGATVEELLPDYVANVVEPGLRPGPQVDRIYRFPDDGWVDTARMRKSVIRAAARRFGVTHVRDIVVGIEAAGNGGGNTVALKSGRIISGDVIVLAAGVWCHDLAKLAGRDVPVRRQTSVLLVTEPVPQPPRNVVHTERLWLRPDRDRRLWIGCSVLPRTRAEAAQDSTALAQAIGLVGQLFPRFNDIRIDRIQEGVQPVPDDNYPVIGFDAEVDGLYYVVGRSGVSMAPRLAKIVLMDFLGNPPAYLERLRLSRFGKGVLQAVGPPGEE